MEAPTPARVSYERIALESLRAALVGLSNVEVTSGHRADNRFSPPAWDLTVGQSFQFGDLRVETPSTSVIVEVESAGGVGNLVKYWPLLAGGEHKKRFVLIHIFQIASDGDYIAHRRLWGFVIERMREHLDTLGISYPDAWEARLFTYRRGQPMSDAISYLKELVAIRPHRD